MNQGNLPVMTGQTQGGSTKNENLQLLQEGPRVGRIFLIADIGNQYSKKFNEWNPKIRMVVEFCELRQQIYVDDTELKPKVISQEFTNSMGSKANLRKFVESALNKRMSQDEANNFNIFSLIDQYFVFNIQHNVSKSNGKTYENITTVMPYNSGFAVQGADYSPYNPVVMFHIPTHGFNSQEYSNLYGYIRKEIKESQEGQQHVHNGGSFNDPQSQNNNNSQGAQPGPGNMGASNQNFAPNQNVTSSPNAQGGGPMNSNGPAHPQNNGPQMAGQQVSRSPGSPAPQQQQAPQKQLQMLVNDYTMEQYLANPDWTKELLVQHGKAKWVTNPAGAPQSAPQSPQSPQGNFSGPQNNQQFSQAPQAQNGFGGFQGGDGNDDLPF